MLMKILWDNQPTQVLKVHNIFKFDAVLGPSTATFQYIINFKTNMPKSILKGLYKTTKGMHANVLIDFFIFLFFIEIKPCLKISH